MHAVSHVNSLMEVVGTTGRAAGLQPKSSGFTNILTWRRTFEKHVIFCKIQILHNRHHCVRKTGFTTPSGQPAPHPCGLTLISNDTISDSCCKILMPTMMDSLYVWFNNLLNTSTRTQTDLHGNQAAFLVRKWGSAFINISKFLCGRWFTSWHHQRFMVKSCTLFHISYFMWQSKKKKGGGEGGRRAWEII